MSERRIVFFATLLPLLAVKSFVYLYKNIIYLKPHFMCARIGKNPLYTIAASTFLAGISALEKKPVQH